MAKVFNALLLGSLLISTLILLCLLLDWFPTSKNIDGSHRLLAMIAFAIFAGILSALSVTSLFLTRIKTSHWNLQKLRPLTLVIFLSLLLSLTAWLSPDDFSNSQEELELVSEEVRQQPLGWEEGYGFENPRHIGSVEIFSIRHDRSGAVIFTDADSSATLFIQGWIKAPTSEKPSIPGAKVHHLTNDWYGFRSR